MNACEDSLRLLLKSYITAAAMEILEIESVDESPLNFPDDMWVHDKDERQRKMDSLLSNIVEKYVDVTYNVCCQTCKNEDQIMKYTQQLLSTGCVYLELTDAIKEGDGDRVLRCWKYLLIIFHNSNRKKSFYSTNTTICSLHNKWTNYYTTASSM